MIPGRALHDCFQWKKSKLNNKNDNKNNNGI